MRREFDIDRAKKLAMETQKVIIDATNSLKATADSITVASASIEKTAGDIRFHEGRLSVLNELLTLEANPLPAEAVAVVDTQPVTNGPQVVEATPV